MPNTIDPSVLHITSYVYYFIYVNHVMVCDKRSALTNSKLVSVSVSYFLKMTVKEKSNQNISNCW